MSYITYWQLGLYHADNANSYITPTKGLLANQESSMLLLSPNQGRREKIYQMDLESERVSVGFGAVRIMA